MNKCSQKLRFYNLRSHGSCVDCPKLFFDSTSTMRAEIVAYMIYSEMPKYPEYVMHILCLKIDIGTPPPQYENMLGSSLPVGAANRQQKIT